MKGSLNAFMNAMTFPDKTIYPVASTNLKDLYNLVDATWMQCFIRLSNSTLRREKAGVTNPTAHDDRPIRASSSNEMKGASVTPERITYRSLMAGLFPDTLYAHDSGGDPLAIPSLSYADFVAFHQTYYHPSNALIFWYGDDDIDARLTHLEPYLAEFSAQAPAQMQSIQPQWDAPRRISVPYPAAADETRHHVNVAWLVQVNDDAVGCDGNCNHQRSIVGFSSCATTKLRDSNLGEELSGGGFGNNKQHYFLSWVSKMQAADVEQS
jgi:Zn-dependent M16 (insulinase) family peptidase